ncbi:hypothetical protein ACEN9F_30540 [Duganella sp. CT11-25]|uniref:hypothetical protein n=1 Tax=unclassified Duganella TaxID=2636909 RepID=UPI0039B05ECA
MYDNRLIIAFSKSAEEVNSLAERFISALLGQKPHPRSQGQYIEYSSVGGAQFSFEASAHLTKMRFKLRHAIFDDGESKYLVGEFDWYFPDAQGKFQLSGNGIQLIPTVNVLLPGGTYFELYSGSDESELERLELAVSQLVMHEIQSRMVLIEKH